MGWTVRLITEQVSDLDRATHTQVDADLAARRPEQMDTREAPATTQRLTYQGDPQAAMARARKATSDRRVTLRPAPDTMNLLTGLLSVEQGVACLAGQQTAEDIGVEVGIRLPRGALIDPDDPTAAEIPGWGALPAGLARELIVNAQGWAWWRRLFTRPHPERWAAVVDLDHRRRFTGWLASSSGGGTGPAVTPPVMPRSAISIISTATTTAGPPHQITDEASANAATTSAICPAGPSASSIPTPPSCSPPTPTGHQYLSNPPEPP